MSMAMGRSPRPTSNSLRLSIGQATDATNFRQDVNADGVINQLDSRGRRIGTSLPSNNEEQTMSPVTTSDQSKQKISTLTHSDAYITLYRILASAALALAARRFATIALMCAASVGALSRLASAQTPTLTVLADLGDSPQSRQRKVLH